MSAPGWPSVALCALLLSSAASAVDAGAPALPYALGLPGKDWKLLVELPGFLMEPVQQRAGGARALGAREASGLSVSLTLATSPGDPSPKSCRDHDWAGRQKSAPSRQETRLSAEGDQARVEFTLPDASGDGPPQKHVLVYLQRDGVCAIVHVSLSAPGKEASADMERLLATVRLGT